MYTVMHLALLVVHVMVLIVEVPRCEELVVDRERLVSLYIGRASYLFHNQNHHMMKGVSTMFPEPMLSGTLYLCSPVPMFPGTDVPSFLYCK